MIDTLLTFREFMPHGLACPECQRVMMLGATARWFPGIRHPYRCVCQFLCYIIPATN